MTTSSLSPPITQRGWFDVLDDWLKRDRFVFVGWSGLLLLPTAYLAIGGWLLNASGLVKSLWICGILQLLSNLMFAAQAEVGHSVSFLALTIGFENLSGGMGTAIFIAYLSSLCNISYTATQYALLSSLFAIPRTLISSGTGYVAEAVAWTDFFIYTAVGAVPGLLLLWFLTKRGWIGEKPADPI